MPRKRSVQEWAEYLNETDQSVDDAVERTESVATAGWLQENRYKIETRRMNLEATASFEASDVEFPSDDEVIEILDSSEAPPNEPDEPQEESGLQRGVRL